MKSKFATIIMTSVILLISSVFVLFGVIALDYHEDDACRDNICSKTQINSNHLFLPHLKGPSHIVGL